MTLMNFVFIGLLLYNLLISSGGEKCEQGLDVSGIRESVDISNIKKKVLYKWFNLLFCFYF